MSPIRRPFSAASPVIAMPPQPAHDTAFVMKSIDSSANTLLDSNTQDDPCTIEMTFPADKARGAGRKRSRDEAAANLMDESPEQMPAATVAESHEDWEYGEGMMLIKPNGGYVAQASNQSNTWLEEQAAPVEVEPAATVPATSLSHERPTLRSNKSQRLTQNTSAHASTEGRPSPPRQAVPGSDESSPAPLVSSGLSGQPVVDDFTMQLGIGWCRLSDEEHIQAAARGWSRYIENHYPLSSVTVQLESKGLQAYLIEAAEGFFLFSEDLKQGRLVSVDATNVLHNLKSSPPAFEGTSMLIPTTLPTQVVTEPENSVEHRRVDADMIMS